MKALVYILSLSFTLISLSTFASGGGGGVLARVIATQPGGTKDTGLITSGFTKTPEIVFNLGQNNGTVKFAYGQLVNKKWQIESIEMTVAELSQDSAVVRALQDSRDLKTWAEIK
ncbi:hypothetical protein K2P97_12820 [bacterium]|nr:hypothetical protein [bacterium]